MNQNHYISLFFLAIIACLLSNCKKPETDNNIELRFSSSMVTFDTVFTTIGSTTRSFTVYNPSDQNTTVDIYLASGSTSYYSLNVNGVAGNDQRNVIIPARDSIFVFVKVNINPSGQNTPFLVTDSIIFENKYIKQDVDLMAYGQDAHFIVADPNTGMNIIAHEHETVTWTNDKPYVVYGGWVVVDSLGTLNIEPGTRIYFHKGSGLWVWRYGNIHVNGTQTQPVTFRGDRLEPQFENDCNQWDRIWILEGNEENTINYAIISGAYVGLQIEPWGGFNEITVTENRNVISNTIIKNTYNSGILARYSNIEATNCVIGNNGSCSLQLEGGTYKFTHVTVGNYYAGTPNRQNPALYLSNSTQLYGLPYPTEANFTNSIIYGNVSSGEEILITKDASTSFTYTFDHCLIRSSISGDNFVNCNTGSPEFVNTTNNDYHLGVFSYAINRGKQGVNVPYDLDGKTRGNIPDIGAYEY